MNFIKFFVKYFLIYNIVYVNFAYSKENNCFSGSLVDLDTIYKHIEFRKQSLAVLVSSDYDCEKQRIYLLVPGVDYLLDEFRVPPGTITSIEKVPFLSQMIIAFIMQDEAGTGIYNNDITLYDLSRKEKISTIESYSYPSFIDIDKNGVSEIIAYNNKFNLEHPTAPVWSDIYEFFLENEKIVIRKTTSADKLLLHLDTEKKHLDKYIIELENTCYPDKDKCSSFYINELIKAKKQLNYLTEKINNLN